MHIGHTADYIKSLERDGLLSMLRPWSSASLRCFDNWCRHSMRQCFDVQRPVHSQQCSILHSLPPA